MCGENDCRSCEDCQRVIGTPIEKDREAAIEAGMVPDSLSPVYPCPNRDFHVPLSLSEYAAHASRTAQYQTMEELMEGMYEDAMFSPPDPGLFFLRGGMLYPTLGLVGEAGEFADKIKKVWRNGRGSLTEDQRQGLIDELGDVLWYVAACAKELGAPLEEVARRNLEKLASRQQRGVVKGEGDKR